MTVSRPRGSESERGAAESPPQPAPRAPAFVPVGARPDPLEHEARERVRFVLSALTMVLWFLLTFGVAAALQAQRWEHPARVIPLGFALLPVAALPWLAYRRLVRAAVRRERAKAGGPPC